MHKLVDRYAPRALAVAIAASLAILLCTLIAPARALAADSVAYSDDSGNRTYYSSIDEAITAGYGGKTIVMSRDWELSECIKIKENATLVIDMSGHKIANNGSSSVVGLGEGSHLTLQATKSTTFTYDGDSSMYDAKTQQKVTAGGLITGGYSPYDGGGVCMDAGSTLTLDNVAVAGNRAYDGGGVYVKKNCTINMKNNAVIEHNRASGPGGGIYVGDEEVTINMDGAYIRDNYAFTNGGGISSSEDATRIFMENGSSISRNTACEGGGIYYGSSYFHLESRDKTASISDNKATGENNSDGGGGIRVVAMGTFKSTEGTIKGLTISGNSSASNGGGIYNSQDKAQIVDCAITGNASRMNGGGIHLNGSGCGINGCTITGNYCDGAGQNNEGGGIFVAYSYDITLTGVCTVKGNTRGANGSADDLFLGETKGNLARAYILGGVDPGSSVGVRTGASDDERIGKNISKYADGAYFMDLDAYHVEYVSGDSELWQRKGAAAEAATNVELMVKYPTTDYNLPATAKLSWYTGDEVEVGIVWLDENGNKVTKAEHGAKYRFYVVVGGNTDGTPSFASSINATNVTLHVPEGLINPGVQDAHVDSYGQLNVTTEWFTTVDPKDVGGNTEDADGSAVENDASGDDASDTQQVSTTGSATVLAQTGDSALAPMMALVSVVALASAVVVAFVLRRGRV